MKMYKVLILLSTYNGEKYLREQLDSLFVQRGVDVYIIARDDGSRDSTISILQEYREKFKKMSIYCSKNVGPAKSFFLLLKYAVEEKGNYDYYCYSDQDDVWFEDKIINSVEALNQSIAKYKMAYCDMFITDANLVPFNDNNKSRDWSLNTNIISNHIAGCCQLFNRAMLDQLVKINSQRIQEQYPCSPFLHDSWTAVVAYALGAYVYHDRNPRMYYRQHGNNAVGNVRGCWNLYRSRILRYIKPAQHSKSAKCVCLQLLMWNEIPKGNRFFIDLCANYQKSILKKIRLLFSRYLYSYSFGENVGAFILVLLNKF